MRIDFPGVAVSTVSFASSHLARFLASLNAANSLAMGTAIVLLLLISHSPLRCCPRARRPRIRSYPTATVCVHQLGVSYFSRMCRQVSVRHLLRVGAVEHVDPLLPIAAGGL